MNRCLRFGPAFACAALILSQALFVAAYVRHEHTVYFWDHAMYFGLARGGFAAFAHGWGEGFAYFYSSLANDYNLIFALPSFAAFALFGVSRLVFILTNFLVFFVAYEMAVAFVLWRGLRLSPARAVFISIIICSLIPPLWVPLLEGYPDAGAAASIVFAFGLALTETFAFQIARRALIFGAFLALAILLRRHYVYPALALLIASGLIGLFCILREKKAPQRWRQLAHLIGFYALTGVVMAALLAAVAPEFLQRALTIDYTGFYASYKKPALAFLRFAMAGFGFLLAGTAAFGLLLLAREGGRGKKLVLFAGLFTALDLILWCAGPDEMGHHYILHVLPLLTALGLAGWVFGKWPKAGAPKYLLAGSLALALLANSAFALWFGPGGLMPNDNGAPSFASSPRPPAIRPDYDELLRLAKYLGLTTLPHDRILAIGSSFIFNQDILSNIYTDILDADEMPFRFLQAPEVDRIQAPPLNVFAEADVYVVPGAPQYHLGPQGQHVVTAAADQFPPPASRTDLFSPDDQIFHLMNGVDVKVWRRKNWTPEKLHAALQDIRRDAGESGLFPQNWVTLMTPLRAQIVSDGQNFTLAGGIFDQDHKELGLFFDYPLSSGQYRLGFTALTDSNCKAPHFRVRAMTGTGATVIDKSFDPQLAPAETFQFAALPDHAGENYFLRLDLALEPLQTCRAVIKDLRVEKVP